MRFSNQRFALLLIIPLAVFAHACSQPDPTATASPEPTPTVESESPLPVDSPLNSALSSPLPSQLPTPTPLPAPEPGKGSVTGRILNAVTGQDVVGIAVYLGTFTSMGSDGGQIVTMRENTSPQTLSNLGGYFAISDVEPGTYALILWTPFNSIVVPDPETGAQYAVTVEAGEITDLGDVVSVLP
jgi:hypothetical protein